MVMQLGFIGLGRMGSNIVLNLRDKGVNVLAFNRSPGPRRAIARQGVKTASTLEDLCVRLQTPRVVWLMVSAGKPVDAVIDGLLPFLQKGDIVIDGGNSFYEDSIRRGKKLARHGIGFLDVGTSGGLEGARHGACLTIGGPKKTFEKLEQLFKAMATRGGYLYCGESGAGHFVKMVHNGIEYGLLQAYGEGFELLAKSKYALNLQKIAGVWSHGSVVRSWLVELAERAFAKDARLKKILGVVGGGETGRWTLATGKKYGVILPVLESSLAAREASLKKERFSGRVIAAIRKEFGGHEVVKASK